MSLIVDSDVTAIYSQLLEKLTGIPQRHICKVTSDAYLNRPLGSPLALHKRQLDPLDTLTEAVEFCHRHSELVRLIL
jgi:hypothetical protein